MLVGVIGKFSLFPFDACFAGANNSDLNRFRDDSRVLKGMDCTVAKTVVPQNCVEDGCIDCTVVTNLGLGLQ
jgi:hypothetical protein